jgi:ribonuclease PH
MNRHLNRPMHKIRPVQLTYNIYEYAAGSVLFQIGRTKVLCAVTVGDGVPQFLRGSGAGWLTAEYSMLPTSTHSRTERESVKKRSGRSVEISRLIGRSLRSIIDFKALGERTLIVDCDVLQADGGTRSAAISGAYCALKMAEQKLLAQKTITRPLLTDEVAAISVGIFKNNVLLDLDCKEDMDIDADFNYVMTRSGAVIEIQGSAEKHPISWEQVNNLYQLAKVGTEQVFEFVDSYDQITQHNLTHVSSTPL